MVVALGDRVWSEERQSLTESYLCAKSQQEQRNEVKSRFGSYPQVVRDSLHFDNA